MRSSKEFALFLLGLSLLISISGANTCLCDVSQACDLLCCCDPECSEADFTRFGCQETSATIETPEVTCVPHGIFSKITPDSSFNFLRIGDDNCFTSTKLTQDASSTKSVSAKASSIPHQESSMPPTFTKTFSDVTPNSSLNYRDLLYIQDNSISKPLTLPAGFRGHCVKDSVKFLRNTTTSCALATAENCRSGSILDSSVYSNWKIVKNFKISADDIVDVTTNCVNPAGDQLTCEAPTSSAGTCSNAVTKVALSVEYGVGINNTVGLISADVVLTLDSASESGSTTLTVTTTFNGNSQDYPNQLPPVQRYRRGFPLQFQIAGQKATFSPFSEDTDCKTQEVVYPGSFITNCVKAVTTPIADVDLTALTQNMFQNLPTHLGKYYSSDISVLSDWIALDRKLPQVIQPNSVPMNIILTINYRSYGNKLNPENEITSAVTSLASTDLSYLEKDGLIKNKLVFYFTVQFINTDERSSKEDIITKLTDSVASYFAYQRDSVPLQLFVVSVAVFVLLTLFVLVADQGKPQF